ncbi:hypothetical protein ACFXPI_11370 [Streptomyces sp. NPDC059104]|uniref:hypothetical protein n=1 Tax=Streptomyces sp. NPDC059104 TaxID=3346729 RepID=UPI0036753548
MATHEAFHWYEQFDGDAPWEARDRPRGEPVTDYPLRAEPRILRAMIYNALLDAYRSPGSRDEHLAAAAYWYHRWSTGYAAEKERTHWSDVMEGTAHYADTAAVGMAGASDPDDLRQRRAVLADVLQPIESSIRTGLEHYKLGPIAGLLLDDMGREWKQEVTAEGLEDTGRPLLRIPRSAGGGGGDGKPAPQPFTGTGPCRTPAGPYAFQAVEKGEFTTPAGTLEASGTAVFLDGNRLTLTGTTLSGNIEVSTTTDPRGRTVHQAAATP